MYPKNAASPERIAIGPVIQISDGAVQTSGCTVRILPFGGNEADGGGTTAYSTDGVVLYTPTQGETNYTSFVLIAKKTGCIPASITVITTDTATAGRVNVAAIAGTSQTGRDIGASVLISPGTGTGQLNVTSGVVDANMTKVAGTTQTAGDLAALLADVHNDILDLTSTGVAVNEVAGSFVLTTGTETNTYVKTHARDNDYHSIAEVGNAISGYYEVNIGDAGKPSSLTIAGRLKAGTGGGTDALDIDCYDWVGGTWEHISPPAGGDFLGVVDSNSNDSTKTMTLYGRHVGSGADAGKVRIRLRATGLKGGAIMRVDSLYIQYAVVFTEQMVADALKLTPTAGAPAAGSAMDYLADINAALLVAIDTIAQIKGAVAGKRVISANGKQVQVYDDTDALLATLKLTGTGPYTWSVTWV